MAPDINAQENKNSRLATGIVFAVIVIVLAIAVWFGVSFATEQAKEQAAESVRQSVLDVAMQCFAIEGVYPPSLKYMEENYGLAVNQDEYVILYDIFAGNIPPIVRVSAK